MQLSARMERLASKVKDGSRLADVGTDHGYIPIALVLRRRISAAVAMDVNPGPLERARSHIREQGLSTYIDTRLSDGLGALEAGEADTVLIAGMGGALTVRILEGGGHCLWAVEELILQPQSEIHLVRRWLQDHGYRITEEDVVLDGGKYYPMMCARHGEQEPLKEAELHFGRVSLQGSLPVLKDYVLAEFTKCRAIRERLREHGKEESPRMKELDCRIGWLEETLEEIGREEKERDRI